MKRCVKYFVGVLLTLSVFVGARNVLALTYSQDIGVSFTFHPVIGLTLSSDLIIPNLTPGTATDSNIIDVNVITNSTNGYTLNASVGNSTTYNTRNLVHTNNTVPNTFSSVDFGSSITSNTSLSDNTWAYSYSINDGTNWTNYSGLPLYSDTTNVAQLKNSSTPVSSASGDNIKFKIAAKASNTQASGEYRNVINFELVATPLPTTLSMAYENAGKEKLNGYFKLQDMNADICNAAEVLDEGSQMQAIDTRDNKVYWITKLRDGKCWFTQNLDHDIDPSFNYTHNNTDLGYSTNTTQSWVPDKATYQTGTTTWDTSSTGYNIQQSYDPGDKIWDGVAYPLQTVCISIDDMAQGQNTHHSLGNFYNWGAAVAINNTSAYTTKHQDVDQSICPANWTLPESGDIDSIPQTRPGSFQYLAEQYGYDPHPLSQGEQQEPPKPMDISVYEPPFYFTLGGAWDGGPSCGVSNSGAFWSKVIGGNTTSFSLDAVSENDLTDPGSQLYRYLGLFVRCVSR